MAPIAALVALAGATFCFVTGENLPVALLPLLSSGLRVSLSTVGLLVTVYAGVVIVVSAPLTRLTRQLPRRLLLSALVAVFALTTLAAAVVPSYGWMVAVRVGTALAQAIFWSIVAVVAVGLPLPRRGPGRRLLRGQRSAGGGAGREIRSFLTSPPRPHPSAPLHPACPSARGRAIAFVFVGMLRVALVASGVISGRQLDR